MKEEIMLEKERKLKEIQKQGKRKEMKGGKELK